MYLFQCSSWVFETPDQLNVLYGKSLTARARAAIKALLINDEKKNYMVYHVFSVSLRRVLCVIENAHVL